jgi:ABC-type sugar transport system ATPase subunit
MLLAEGIVKAYGGVHALAGADLRLRPGQVHALLGENGAGKSTLVRIVTGLEQPDAGELLLDGSPVHWRTALAARAAGVATVSQELSLFPDLDVLSNLFSHGPPTRWGMPDRASMRARARPHLKALGLGRLDPRTRLSELSLAEQQLVEIARALIADPAVLVLDEPTSALGAAATERLLGLIREIADRGVAVLYVSHFLQEVTAIADRVTVLRDGRNTITDRAMSGPEAPSVADLVHSMLGTTASNDRADPGSAVKIIVDEDISTSEAAEPVVRLRAVSVPGQLADVDLDIRRGEIVGLAGLQGAGHEALLALLWGLRPLATGEVKLPRAQGVPSGPRAALRAGVAHIPSDRKRLGLMLDKTVWENITAVTALAGAGTGTGTGTRAGSGRWLRRTALRALARQWMDELRIRGQLDAPVATLSGGNQQKVVFAKWLATAPDLLLLDDPTRGVDVGAKREMHALITAAAAGGCSVLLCSTDLTELATLCHRVAVFRHGRLLTTPAPRTEAELLSQMNG